MVKRIVLVHGLGGAADGTWGKFPDFLMQDKDLDYEVISYGYESPNFLTQFYKRAPSILNIANGLLTDLQVRCDLDNDEIILAGHSLGGVVVKKLLLRMKDKKINHKIKKVCFFDVPHDGSGFANVGKYIALRNRHLKSLCRDSSELDDLNDQWVDSELDSALNIMSIVAANDDIVSSSSAKSIFRHHRVETINDVNHKTIVKPESMESSAYLVFKQFILDANTVHRYKNKASRDLEDWKSVERNHSYHYTSDENRSSNLNSLVAAFEQERAVIRLTGASGLGKTRLILEAIDRSSIIDDSCVLIFNAPGYDTTIKDSIRTMVDDQAHGLVVIENCSVDLHNDLAREVNKTECFLKLITIGYSDEQVDDSIHIQLSPLSDEAIKQVLSPILVGMDSSDVDRVARFAQGYPLMATLIAEQYQKEGKLLGSIDSSSVVRKLIDGDGGISRAEREVLCACSLFDVFGTSEGVAGVEAKFIAEDVAGSDLRIFDRVIKLFTRRQIINRAGRYARLVPKPLALTLASEWWEETSYERQKQLIDSLPDSLMQSFCTQAAYLDAQPSVQKFSDRLFGGSSPFVQAEELLTEKGSKLFRAFVEVNPESTVRAIYQVLSELSHEQLLAIEGDIRRNLVWGLEKLCFHEGEFEKAAWCMLLLASAENEGWSNNATGMFAQLFRVSLSGTQAKPSVRFDLLNRAVECCQDNFDMVVLKALEQAISTYGGTRTVGAEYQGTKATLEEWQPSLWREVFDYWQQAFDLMLLLLSRGETQKQKVLADLGHSIRGFVARGRVEMLDAAIRKIVSENGRYWPEALEGINNTIEFDSSGMTQEVMEVLDGWLELLSPEEAELPEKLKILVIDPPWEHRKGDDGHYVDIAAEKVRALAKDVSKNIHELFPHLRLLLQGEQKQTFILGHQLAIVMDNIQPLLDSALDCFAALDMANSRLIQGLYQGLYEKSPKLWQENIDRLYADEKLVSLYPEMVCTGDVQNEHLEKILDLVQRGVLPPQSANPLGYGSVTEHVEANAMADFCLRLAGIGDHASWVALNLIYMYCYSNKGAIDILRDTLKLLVSSVPLHNSQEGRVTDSHHWHDLAKKLLKKRDEAFAIALVHQMIKSSKDGMSYGDIWSYIKPLVMTLMEEYGEVLWPVFGDAIIQSEGKDRYWLQQLLDRESGLASDMPSVLSVLPVESVIKWCQDFPDVGPAFVARCLNLLEPDGEAHRPSELFIALLSRFGGDEDVAAALSANITSRGWTGSLVPYLESDKAALIPLLDHENVHVRHWTKDHIAYLEKQIKYESARDDEQGLGVF